MNSCGVSVSMGGLREFCSMKVGNIFGKWGIVMLIRGNLLLPVLIMLNQYSSFVQRVRRLKMNIIHVCDRLCGLVVWVPGYRSRGPGSISGCSGSGTGSTQPHEYNWGATWKKNSGSCLEIKKYGRWDQPCLPRDILNSQKFALTSPTIGGLSVGIVRSRTMTTEFSFS
jgi:hypothetical protein